VHPEWLAEPAVRRVAVMRLRVGLGDLLCTVPALRALRSARPDLHVTLVTWAETAPVVARMARYVDRLVGFPGFPGIPEREPQPSGWEPFLRELGPVDLAVQAYGDNAAANLACDRLGAPRVAGFWPTSAPAAPPPGHLPYPHDRHEIRRHLDLVAHLGVSVAGPDAERLEFPLTEQDRAAAAHLRRTHDLHEHAYAVLHPGATSASRRWPVERFAAVADELDSRGLRLVLTGVPTERDTTTAVARAARCDVLDLTGATSLGSLAMMLRDAAVVVANDTGTAHLGAAVGARTVTIFLSGDPLRWAYPSPRHPIARRDVGCNPCRHLTCPIDFRCAHGLPVAEVMRQVDRLLPQPARSGSR
jgi:ADP-heptose:LPS heptosyltransferase